MRKNTAKMCNELTRALDAYRTGDKRVADKVYGVIHKVCVYLAKYCQYKKHRKSMDANDIAQNVCMKLLQGGLEKYNPTYGNPMGWLYKIVCNEVNDALRNPFVKNWDAEDKAASSDFSDVAGYTSTDAAVEQAEMKRVWMEALDTLADNDKRIIHAVDEMGEKPGGIAKSMERSSNWVSGRVLHSHNKMKRYIEGKYGDELNIRPLAA